MARTAGLRATSAPYVLPLDADDLAIPAQLTRAADLLDADPDAAAVVGDYEEFGTHAIIRTVPERLDPYRVAYTNEYAITALMRRSVLEGYGGWTDPSPTARGYEDWDLWMDLAEQDGLRIVHVGGALYRRRMHAPGLDVERRVAGTPRSTPRCPVCTSRCSPSWPPTAAARRSPARASCSTRCCTATAN